MLYSNSQAPKAFAPDKDLLKGKITKLSTYPMRNQLQNMPGETPMQADRFYGILNDKDAIIIQYITFQPCLRILSELKK